MCHQFVPDRTLLARLAILGSRQCGCFTASRDTFVIYLTHLQYSKLSMPSNYSAPTTSLSSGPQPNAMYAHAKVPPSYNQMADLEGLVDVSPVAEMPTAIVGMSCRFPGDANNPERFWDLLSNGRSAWSEIPESRFNKDAFYHPTSEKSTTVSIVVLCAHHHLLTSCQDACQRRTLFEAGLGPLRR